MRISKYYKEENYIHYSNCHEDANMLFEYGNNSPKEILSICSALDNSLALLLMNPNKITAIDTNITQIYLAKLKLEAIRNLSYEDYLIFWGVDNGDSLVLYNSFKDKLDKDVRDYFDNHIYLISDIKLLNCGKFEHYFQILSKKVMRIIHRRKTIEKFFEFDNLKEQKTFYSNRFRNYRFNMMFKIFFSKKVMSKLGRDKAYFKYNKSPLVNHLNKRVEIGFSNNLNKDNPYMQYVLFNTYIAKPMYMIKENFNVIKSRLDRIEIRQCSYDEILKENHKYDLMNLSDIFEYLPEESMPSYETRTASILNDKGKVIYWNMVNDRKMGNILREIPSSIEHDRCFYYKAFYVYEK